MRVPRPESRNAAWRGSDHRENNGGNCLQISADFLGLVSVRDSGNPGAALILPTAAWRAFVAHLKG